MVEPLPAPLPAPPSNTPPFVLPFPLIETPPPKVQAQAQCSVKVNTLQGRALYSCVAPHGATPSLQCKIKEITIVYQKLSMNAFIYGVNLGDVPKG